MKWMSLGHVQLSVTPWTVACQAPLSMEFSRIECWSRLPFPSPWDLPNPGTEHVSPALEGRFLTTKPPGKPIPLHLLQYIFAPSSFGTIVSKFVCILQQPGVLFKWQCSGAHESQPPLQTRWNQNLWTKNLGIWVLLSLLFILFFQVKLLRHSDGKPALGSTDLEGTLVEL